ncbi:hypothetical protein HPG69_018716 [Diceros bicornis minor]|uniref:Cytochrome P450 n=1 Tax=Diceros bicornis minor TaxID=77932 RepID=A0A7J7EDH0_DICBM|nr:hypothetical protein HPG69_018716 [Diceros bicornis minor]
MPAVVLNGLAAICEALVDHSEDISDSHPLPEQRHFCVSTLRNFGLGKKSLEHGQRDRLPDLGRRLEYKDRRFHKLLDLAVEQLKANSGFLPQVRGWRGPRTLQGGPRAPHLWPAPVVHAIPVLLHIPGLVDKVSPGQRSYMDLLDELGTEHRMTWDLAQPPPPPRDQTDAFLDEAENAKGNPESSFNDENLRLVVTDLFFAGLVTTSTMLDWALLLMILHPDMQCRVQQEINEVIRQARRPEMEDQAHMPFTIAVVLEVQCFGDIIPLGALHRTSSDIEVQGFLIPKGSMLISLSSVLEDETIWKKPFCFQPEHFQDTQGWSSSRRPSCPSQQSLAPCLLLKESWRYGAHAPRLTDPPYPPTGHRLCLGEPLARMELFLFFTCLLQRFSFSVTTGQPRPRDHGPLQSFHCCVYGGTMGVPAACWDMERGRGHTGFVKM